MDFCMITFRSVTPAQRAERLLKQSGISCNIRRTPRWMETQGCGYGLQVRFADIRLCIQALKQAEIPYRKVYLSDKTGGVEELNDDILG